MAANQGPPSSSSSLPPASERPSLAGLHHLKLAAADVQATHDFYVSVLGFSAQPKLTHRTADGRVYGLLARSPGGVVSPGRMASVLVEFRSSSSSGAEESCAGMESGAESGAVEAHQQQKQQQQQQQQQRGFDPVTWAVATRAELERWAAWFARCGVAHSRVLRGVAGWVLVADDPDGRRVRLYTLEQHDWDENPEWDEEWMGEKP